MTRVTSHTTASTRYAKRSLGGALFTVLLATGCGAEFDSVSQIEGLRILGVQKSDPYAQPGDTVEMRMLLHDTGERDTDEAEGEPRDISLFWLAGCHNPPADLYSLCLEVFSEALTGFETDGSFEDLDPERLVELFASLNERGISFGTEEQFSFRVPHDIVSSRPPPADPSIQPYGLSFVFFAACAGELRMETDEEGEFPLACYDDDGVRVDSERFVAGYSQVFTYEGLSNDNPRIEGIVVDGRRLDDAQYCVGEACETLPPDPERDCLEDVPRVEVCEDEDSGDCDSFEFHVVVDDSSVERDDVLSSSEEDDIDEQMWVNYHTDRGGMKFDVALVNDATAGFNERPFTEYTAPEVPGPAHIWAVVRDNRGGSNWARFQVCVEDD